MVGLVDALEGQGWLERKAKAGDRRARALHLTTAGREMLDRIVTIAADQEEGLRAGLTHAQRQTLIELLDAIAEGQGLVSGVHPDF